jgi:gluconate 2-dehydrogenase gamma chain
MDRITETRRRFVVESCSLLGGTLLAAQLPAVQSAAEYARRAFEQGQPFRILTADEVVDLTAVASQIMPTTDTPGAREAGVIYFIDRALETFSSERLSAVRAGLKDLQSNAETRFAGVHRFSDLEFDQQTEVLKALEETEFFTAMRYLTVAGMFANPSYGGNRDRVGWDLLGFDSSPVFSPPFGYYDREATEGR